MVSAKLSHGLPDGHMLSGRLSQPVYGVSGQQLMSEAEDRECSQTPSVRLSLGLSDCQLESTIQSGLDIRIMVERIIR